MGLAALLAGPLGLGAAAAPVAAGTVSLVSSSRQASTGATVNTLEEAEDFDTVSTDAEGFFEGGTVSLADPTPGGPEGDEVRSAARQSSTIGDGGLSVDAVYDFDVFPNATDLRASAGAEIRASYEVSDGDVRFSFDLDMSEVLTSRDENFAGFSLSDAATGQTLFQASGNEEGSGLLGPGLYNLSYFVTIGTRGLGLDQDGGYGADLRFEDAGGGGAQPIPLPPACWAGLATFGAWAGGRALRRRCRKFA